MSESILTSTKKVLGMDESYTAFDADVILHINGALNNLQDIGIGPDDGFMIADKTPTWDEFIGTETRLNSVKNYVFLFTKLAFDPPERSYVITAMQDQCDEAFGRLRDHRESVEWTPGDGPIYPIPPVDEEE